MVLVAPRIFTGFWEFHFGLVGCVVLLILVLARDRSSWWYWPKWFSYVSTQIPRRSPATRIPGRSGCAAASAVRFGI